MAWPYARRVGNEILKRAVEETTQRHIEEAILAGEDTNALSKRFFRLILGEDSPVVRAARTIPGFRFAQHSVMTLVADWLEHNADGLFPGKNGAAFQILRLALKTAAPMLSGVSEATADVMQKVGESVDRVVSPAASATRNALLDHVVVVVSYFDMQPFYPVAKLPDGSIEYVELGGYRIPRVLDIAFERFRDGWLREHPAQRVFQGGNKNQQTRVDNVASPVPWSLYTLQEYADLVARRGGGVSEAELARLREHFARPRVAGEWNDDVFAVFIAAIQTLDQLRSEGQLDWMDRQDFESLVETLYKANPSIHKVNQMIGRAFAHRIIQDGPRVGQLPPEVLRQLLDTIDIFLGGEQSLFTTILRRWRDLRREGHATGNGFWWLSVGVLGFTSPIWASMLLIGFLILTAVYMAIEGVMTPIEGMQEFFGKTMSGKAYAFWMAFGSGWLAFAATRVFPFFQTLTDWLRKALGLREDWLVSLGRRVAGFGLTVISTMIPLAILMEKDWMHRVLILSAAGFAIGMAFTMVEAGGRSVEAGWRSKVEETVAKNAPWLNAVFGGGTLAYVYLGDLVLNSGDEARGLWDTVLASKWLQLVALGLALIVALVVASLIEHRKVPSGPYRLPIRGKGWAIAIVILALIGQIFLFSPPKAHVGVNEKVEDTDVTLRNGKSRVRVREQVYEDGTTKRQVRGTVDASSAVPSKKKTGQSKKERLCADPELPETHRRELNCP